MIQEVYPNIFLIEVPLPDTPLKVINSYFIRGKERNLIVDTGFRCDESLAAFQEAMKSLRFTMENTDLFLTHPHSDHCGLTSTLATETTRIYASKETALSVTDETTDDWSRYLDIAGQSGLPEMEMETHPGYRYATLMVENVTIIQDGDVLEVGDYRLTCIDTTGHAPGHMCLFCEEEKFLFSGDHILAGITPNNTIWDRPWGIKEDLLGDYLNNLEKVRKLNPKILFPAHRALIHDGNQRIQELIDHHLHRLDAVRNILKEESHLHGATVASRMQWQIRAKDWESFPSAQKLFATGEAMSHLIHLLFREELIATFEEGVMYFSLKESVNEEIV